MPVQSITVIFFRLVLVQRRYGRYDRHGLTLCASKTRKFVRKNAAFYRLVGEGRMLYVGIINLYLHTNTFI